MELLRQLCDILAALQGSAVQCQLFALTLAVECYTSIWV